MGQCQWLKELYDANYNRIYKLVSYKLWYYTGRTEDAQDIVQEVFLLAYQKDIRNHANPEAWLTMAAKYLCHNHNRARKRNDRKQEKALNEMQAERKQRPRHIEEAAIRNVDTKLALENVISREDYEIIEKHYIQGFSLEEIAQQMGVSPVALRVRLHRLRKKLKNYFLDM